MLNIVLFEPEIPENTGNISRTCVGFDARLHLIKPYGFVLNDKTVKRAGLDYWKDLKLYEYNSWDEFEKENDISINSNIFLISKFGDNSIYNIDLKDDFNKKIFIVFGKETKGLPKTITEKYNNKLYSIPMSNNIRSFNLSNCVAMLAYEYAKQNNFR